MGIINRLKGQLSEHNLMINDQRQVCKSNTKEVIDETKLNALKALLEEKSITKTTVCKLYKVKDLEELTENQHANIVKNIDKIKEKQEEKKNE